MYREGVNNTPMRMPREKKRIKRIKVLQGDFTKSSHGFLFWKNTTDMAFV